MIDAHCHFDMFPNPIEIVNRCERDHIITLGMTNLPSHFEMGYPHVSNCRYVRLSLGMHPLMANEAFKEQKKFTSLLEHTSYIGEVGLDFSIEGISTKDTQIKNFEFVLNSIKGRKKIVSIHSRRAERLTLELLSKYEIENAIFHWFSGDLSILKKIAECGYFFSVNPAMIKSTNGKRIIQTIPLNKILTETDAPFTEINNRITIPQDVNVVINHLADLHSVSVLQMQEQINSNFKQLINKIR